MREARQDPYPRSEKRGSTEASASHGEPMNKERKGRLTSPIQRLRRSAAGVDPGATSAPSEAAVPPEAWPQRNNLGVSLRAIVTGGVSSAEAARPDPAAGREAAHDYSDEVFNRLFPPPTDAAGPTWPTAAAGDSVRVGGARARIAEAPGAQAYGPGEQVRVAEVTAVAEVARPADRAVEVAGPQPVDVLPAFTIKTDNGERVVTVGEYKALLRDKEARAAEAAQLRAERRLAEAAEVESGAEISTLLTTKTITTHHPLPLGLITPDGTRVSVETLSQIKARDLARYRELVAGQEVVVLGNGIESIVPLAQAVDAAEQHRAGGTKTALTEAVALMDGRQQTAVDKTLKFIAGLFAEPAQPLNRQEGRARQLYDAEIERRRAAFARYATLHNVEVTNVDGVDMATLYKVVVERGGRYWSISDPTYEYQIGEYQEPRPPSEVDGLGRHRPQFSAGLYAGHFDFIMQYGQRKLAEEGTAQGNVVMLKLAVPVDGIAEVKWKNAQAGTKVRSEGFFVVGEVGLFNRP